MFRVIYSGFLLITINCAVGNDSPESNKPDAGDDQEILCILMRIPT